MIFRRTPRAATLRRPSSAPGRAARVFFDPARTRAAIVTCGGLCPGLNDVVRALVMELRYWYQIREVLAFITVTPGCAPTPSFRPSPSAPEASRTSTCTAGRSWGPRAAARNAGDDGRYAGAAGDRHSVLRRRRRHAARRARPGRRNRAARLEIAIVGIPKTIDNDIRADLPLFRLQDGRRGAPTARWPARTSKPRASATAWGLVRLMGARLGLHRRARHALQRRRQLLPDPARCPSSWRARGPARALAPAPGHAPARGHRRGRRERAANSSAPCLKPTPRAILSSRISDCF